MRLFPKASALLLLTAIAVCGLPTSDANAFSNADVLGTFVCRTRLHNDFVLEFECDGKGLMINVKIFRADKSPYCTDGSGTYSAGGPGDPRFNAAVFNIDFSEDQGLLCPHVNLTSRTNGAAAFSAVVTPSRTELGDAVDCVRAR